MRIDEYSSEGIIDVGGRVHRRVRGLWNTLDSGAQEAIAHDVEVLAAIGPGLGRPTVDTVSGSRFANMKELRTQHDGQPLRTLFAFDPRRCAILLIGGAKTGDRRFYERLIPEADRLYQQHLDALIREGLI